MKSSRLHQMYGRLQLFKISSYWSKRKSEQDIGLQLIAKPAFRTLVLIATFTLSGSSPSVKNLSPSQLVV